MRGELEVAQQGDRTQHAYAKAGGRLCEWPDQEAGKKQQSAACAHGLRAIDRVPAASWQSPQGARRGLTYRYLPEQQPANNVGRNRAANPKPARQRLKQVAACKWGRAGERGDRDGHDQPQQCGEGGVQATAGDGYCDDHGGK
ncbi:hypothetical protein D3C75_891660 [compost metagenome]